MKYAYLEINDLGPKDSEWAKDWEKIREVFEKIDRLDALFNSFEVPYLRQLHQKTLILNLKKYAWSLQYYILEKYGNIRPKDEDLI